MLDWVSGHVALPRMQSFLSTVTKRRLRFFSVIRSPVDQVASHYNWLIEIYHRGEAFYKAHPPAIQKLSERIRRTDNTDPEAIIAQLKAEVGLFLNQQSRTLLGWRGAALTEQECLQRLSQYEYVATENDLQYLLQRMTGSQSQAPTHENKSRYHFDPAVFYTDKMQRFLETTNAADILLYKVVTRHDALARN